MSAWTGATRAGRRLAEAAGLAILGLCWSSGLARASDDPTPCVLQVAGVDEPGVPLVVSGRLLGKDGKPIAAARIHVYQADACGLDRHIPAHIHMDVAAAAHDERRLQMVFADDPLLEDPYWRNWVLTQGQPVLDVRRGGASVTGALTINLE